MCVVRLRLQLFYTENPGGRRRREEKNSKGALVFHSLEREKKEKLLLKRNFIF